ncbi:MAG: hypothetical protein NC832_01400 [Candidatus Omnitrophica bacterium]|nr:hypothetical protein [Candidatus Omnitrophota bacterium]
MMDYAILSSVINIGIAFIMIILSAMLLKINRKKFVYGVVLSVIYTGFAVYYLCLVLFFPHSAAQKAVATPITPSKTTFPETRVSTEENTQKVVDFTVIITTEDNTFSLGPDDELEIKKGMKFKIEKVVYSGGSPENIKADIRGFVGNARKNDLQDIGYWVTYGDMLKKYTVEGEKDKFKVEIKEGENLIGTIYIKFVD